jgi:hypothetical protein
MDRGLDSKSLQMLLQLVAHHVRGDGHVEQLEPTAHGEDGLRHLFGGIVRLRCLFRHRHRVPHIALE